MPRCLFFMNLRTKYKVINVTYGVETALLRVPSIPRLIGNACIGSTGCSAVSKPRLDAAVVLIGCFEYGDVSMFRDVVLCSE